MSCDSRLIGWLYAICESGLAAFDGLGDINKLLAKETPPSKPFKEERIEPFNISNATKLRDLKDHSGGIRWLDQVNISEWEYGVPIAYMEHLLENWRDKFDWHEQEKKLT